MSQESQDPVSPADGPWQALSAQFAAAAAAVGGSVVAIEAHDCGTGAVSGVVWRPGVVVTSEQALRRDDDITVATADGRRLAATLAGRDPSSDIAVLKLSEAGPPPAATGGVDGLRVGDLVLGVGRSAKYGTTATLGVVSAAGGPWRSMLGGLIDRYIRLDLALRTVGIGAPLVDSSGRVAGLLTVHRNGAVLLLPAGTVDRAVDPLLAEGRIARGYLGLGMQPVRLSETLRTALALSAERALIVVNVAPGGPAEQAGVLIGDVLLSIDGTAVRDTRDVMGLLGPDSVGRSVTLKLIRGGAPIEFAVTVGRH